jgi:hypothetical protein
VNGRGWDPNESLWQGRARDAWRGRPLVRAICEEHGEEVAGEILSVPESGAVFNFTRAEPAWDPSSSRYRDIYADEVDTYEAALRGTPAESRLRSAPRRSDKMAVDIESTEGKGFIRAECLDHRHDLFFDLVELRTKTRVARVSKVSQTVLGLTT